MFLPNCRYRNLIKALIVLCVLTALVLLIVYTKGYIDSITSKQSIVSATELYRDMNTVYVDGEASLAKSNLKTVLIIGLDIDGKVVSSNSYNNDYNADFLMLATFNTNTGECKLVEINRDSIVPVQRLDIFGQKIDTKPMQICLSYSYGDGLSESAYNTKTAVSDMFYGLNIDYYLVMTRDATRQAVDYINGVDVVMDDDYVDIDASYVKGSVHHMDSEDAMYFVSARHETLAGTNTYRMQRQMCLINSLVSELKEADCDFTELYNSFMDYTITDVDFAVFSRIMANIDLYEYSDVITPSGRSRANLGHNEFYPDEESVKSIAFDVFYDRI